MQKKKIILIGIAIVALLTTIMTVQALTSENTLSYNEYCNNGNCSNQNENGSSCGAKGNCQYYNQTNDKNSGCGCGCSRNR